MSTRECSWTRAAVVRAAVEGEGLEQKAVLHLSICRDCREFKAGVELAPELVAGGAVLSLELRRRAVEAARPTSGRLLTAAAAVAGLVNLVGSLVLPIVVFERGLALFLPGSVALLAAVGLCLSLGLAGTTVLIVVLERAGHGPALEVLP